MKPIAIRFFMIISLLLSLQVAADMNVKMDHTVPPQASAMPHCTDMPGMGDSGQLHAKPASKHQQCKTSCCMSFLSAATVDTVPAIKPVQAYQEITVLPPSRVTRINYRPPIFS